MNDIIFIHGAYHSTWCWEEKFLKIFEENGYRIHCPDLRTFWRTEKKIALLEIYVENLFQMVKTFGGRAILVVHSAYSIVVLEYLKKYPDTVESVTFMSPLPVRLEFPRVLISGIRQLALGQRKFFFSDRLSNQKAEEYLRKLGTQEGNLTIETSRNHWKKKGKLPVPALFVGSENDNCIKAEWVRETARGLEGDCIIYKELCHDMMLDPAATEVAEDIFQFIEKVKGKERKKHGEARGVC